MQTAENGRFAWYDADGVNSGDGITIFAISSGPGFSHKTMRPWLQSFATDFRLISIDLPGCGQGSMNETEGYTFQDYVSDLELAQKQLGADQIVLLGHGWGATLATEFAIANPQSVLALVLASPIRIFDASGQDSAAQARRVAALDPTLIPRWNDELLPHFLAALKGDGPWEPIERNSWWLEMINTQLAKTPPAAWNAVLRDEPWRLRAYASYKGAAMFTQGHAMAMFDLKDRLSQLRPEMPVLVISSDHDANYVAPARIHADPLAQAHALDLVRMDDVGHFPFAEQPERFFEIVSDFLESRIKMSPSRTPSSEFGRSFPGLPT